METLAVSVMGGETSMFVHAWPVWANFVLLVAILFAKWLAVKYIEKTQGVQSLFTGKGWAATAILNAGLNAVATFVVFWLLASMKWAIAFAVIDFVINYLVSYYQQKKTLPSLTTAKVSTAASWWADVKSWFASLNLASYITMASSVISLASGSSIFSTVLKDIIAKL
jgi:hypothetical protein